MHACDNHVCISCFVKCILQCFVELAWRSGSVMDCHTTARGSIPDGISVKNEIHILRKGQLMGMPTNQPTFEFSVV